MSWRDKAVLAPVHRLLNAHPNAVKVKKKKNIIDKSPDTTFQLRNLEPPIYTNQMIILAQMRQI